MAVLSDEAGVSGIIKKLSDVDACDHQSVDVLLTRERFVIQTPRHARC
ncbi:hypothetical protein K0T92_09390 [Paenibacillus oenotherae]|uniref:Uncharacterized protein n=1 Tax=Paenibacillus oenotherae TaxID=1435645 RepID=A0ABS7D5W7_9BACL|nr:hypothetical protein [Paenibacillus oenotherae]MBW7474957.1 hypothetical protein [Paenibacillus oenotherae]